MTKYCVLPKRQMKHLKKDIEHNHVISIDDDIIPVNQRSQRGFGQLSKPICQNRS